VKGTGQAAIEAIVAAREAGGPFTDLFDFSQRIDKRLVNRRAVEALVRAGAFDAVDPRRASLLASVGVVLDHAEKTARAASQVSLFGDGPSGSASTRPALVATREWTEDERLAHEKASLGFYLSGHPYSACAAELASLIQVPLGSIKPTTVPVRIAGVVAVLRTQTSRRGKMAFVTLDDGKDRAEIVVFNETFDAYRHLLREDAVLVAEVKVMQRLGEDGQTQGLRIVAEALYDLQVARRKFARGLRLCCNGSSSAQKLLELIEPFKSGTCAVTIRFQNETTNGDIELGDAWRVKLEDPLLVSLREWLKAENVQIVY
jgi:DNA polymerase-3 subunit alpha